MKRTGRPIALLFSTLPFLFAIACGSSSDSPAPGPPDDGLEFELQLELTDGAILTPTEYAYPRCPEGLDYNGGSACIEPDGRSGWNNKGTEGESLDYLQTAQFILDPSQTPYRLMVRDKKDQSNCMLAYFQGPSTQSSDSFTRFTLGFNDPGTSLTVPTGKLTVETPIHFTLIPVSTTASCANPGVDAQADRIVAAWISIRPSQEVPIANEIVCDLNSGMDFSKDVVDGNCTISAPKWRLDIDAGGSYRRVVYTGTFWDMLGSAPAKISVTLADDLSLPVPLSSAYAAFYLEDATQASDCQDAVDRMNAGLAPENGLCQVNISDNGALFTQPTSAQFLIQGFGRISGYEVLKDFPVNEQINPPASSGAIQDFQDYAEFRIRSYLIGLSSSHPSVDPVNEPAIRVQNVTVGWTAKLGDGSVELNSEYLGVESPSPAYEQAVHLHDYKQVGSWVGQSDGPEVMGHHSLIEYSYLHVADDAVKVSATNVDFSQITVIKGNSGGVVNLGSYGKNRLVDGSVAEKIWVPRITHNVEAGDGALGLILSRTCPYTASLTGATIQNLYVPSLGGGGLPNAVSGLVRLGASSSACGGGAPETGRFTIGDINFLEFNVKIQPQENSVLYADTIQNQSGQDVVINWGKINFYDSSQAPSEDNAVVFFPDSGSTGYYMCAQDVPNVNQCYSTGGPGLDNPAVNLVYEVQPPSSNPAQGDVVYPGGP